MKIPFLKLNKERSILIKALKSLNKETTEISFSSQIDNIATSRIDNKLITIIKNEKPKWLKQVHKENNDTITNHKYSIRWASNSNVKASNAKIDMSKIQDQLIEKNRLHIDDSSKNAMINKFRTESITLSKSSIWYKPMAMKNKIEHSVEKLNKSNDANQKSVKI